MRRRRHPPPPTPVALLVAVGSLLVTLASERAALAQAAPMAVSSRTAAAPAPLPLGLLEAGTTAPLARLDAARLVDSRRIVELETWNRSGRQPWRNGFVRQLEDRRVVLRETDLGLAPQLRGGGLAVVSAAGDLVWGAEVRVDGAHRLRLLLSDVDLPVGTLLWVWGEESSTVGPFGIELLDLEGKLWTPSVDGGILRVEIRVPGGAEVLPELGFTVDAVLELFDLETDGSVRRTPRVAGRGGSCLVDGACVDELEFPVRDAVRRAVARIQFVSGSLGVLCSGGLLNDTDPGSEIPYFLTANHCLSSEAEASTVEAVWDYFSSGCGGPIPSLGSLPRSNGARLLASDPSSDYTLLELDTLPPDRVFLGWDARPESVPPGTRLHRLSHPSGDQQHYSQSLVEEGPIPCEGAPLDSFLYARNTLGGTFGGSSGAPLVTDLGLVVGQLLGGCGEFPEDGCDRENSEVDGAFFASFAALAPFLAGGALCTPDETTLCLGGGRFRVEVSWRTADDRSGAGRVVPGLAGESSAVLWFFNPNNWEMLVKLLPGCPINGHHWVFFTATTDVEYSVTVTDTTTGAQRQYQNPLGRAAEAVTDTTAFATCP